MLPTLVLVYDHSLKLQSVENQVIQNQWTRVIKLDSKVGISLYSTSTQTPFVEGALLFDEMGNKVGTRRDFYDDLLRVIQSQYDKTSENGKKQLAKWYQEQARSLDDLYRKVPDLL